MPRSLRPGPPTPTDPGAFIPRSVRRCEGPELRLTVWRTDGTGQPETLPFRCGSWRCPNCRARVALVDYARIASAVASRGEWLYVVLTADTAGIVRRLPLWDAYREMRRRWDERLRKLLRRDWGALEYIQTWEQHRDGVPHLNLLLRSPELLRSRETTRRGAPVQRRPIRDRAVQAGYGPSCWVQRAGWDDGARRGMASYLVKLSRSVGTGELERAGRLAHELARADQKVDQVPVQAPPRFRRISASRGLLPPRLRSSAWEGAVHRNRGRPWTWADVAAHDLRTERRAEGWYHMLSWAEELERHGLPLPCAARRALEDARRTEDRSTQGSLSDLRPRVR